MVLKFLANGSIICCFNSKFTEHTSPKGGITYFLPVTSESATSCGHKSISDFSWSPSRIEWGFHCKNASRLPCLISWWVLALTGGLNIFQFVYRLSPNLVSFCSGLLTLCSAQEKEFHINCLGWYVALKSLCIQPYSWDRRISIGIAKYSPLS